MMERLMTLRFPLKRELMTTVRLATGGVCSLAGLNVDESEDCKLCVTESLLLLLYAGYPAAKISFDMEDSLGVSLEGEGDAEGSVPPAEGEEISVALLQALVEGLEMTKEDGGVRRIFFRFGS